MKLNTNYDNVNNDALSLFGHGVVEKTATSTFITDGATLVKLLANALKTLATATSSRSHAVTHSRCFPTRSWPRCAST